MSGRLFATILIFASLIISSIGSNTAHAEPATHASVKALMERTGASKIGVQMMGQMLQQLKPLVPGAPDDFWTDFMSEIDEDELTNLVIPIYQKHLTEEDIQAILAFYATPAGKKLIATLPAITQESMAAGQAWGESIAMKALKKIKEHGEKQQQQ